ncbi:DUF3592 domain-containing protein [Micromonospora sagamiensis]|uniref:Uncharacterized protein DUF3592 n=1 Tax=Micromonospora sagamiensis TaxID=47875 RepID=A0A562W9S7_9ACTN|nr:DUF3592 domain-containing protein [Micromonospora sagamiensis]TWJ27039.1 uncharacterized protein DUF3592 [Micromonospora sagamiensis]BCL14070.1 hypothetical protein GCM10017556_18090 [Micromonospora sagamiensis]
MSSTALPRISWVTVGALLLLMLGSALLWLPVHTQLALDDWKTELRNDGVRTQAVVHNRVTEGGGNRSSPSTTMYFRYEVAGRTHEAEVGCVQVCRTRGETVTIWVNRADPSDFVTDFDQLSGHRGRVQGVLGAVGFVVLVVAVPLALSRLPFRRWFPRRPAQRPGRPLRDAEAGDGKPFTGRSKHKRGSRR